MSEMNEKIVVNVGYSGATRPVRFAGKKVSDACNRSTQGANQNRYHSWVLYCVRGGYRVQDTYVTCYQGEAGHTSISPTMAKPEIARKYPELAGVAVDEGHWDVEDIAEDLADGAGSDGDREERE